MPGLHGAMLPFATALLTLLADAKFRECRRLATLTIRKVDPDVQRRLRIRAAQNGRSMEAELRQIINDAVGNAPDAKKETGRALAEVIRRRFAPYGGVELDIPPREVGREPPDFST